MDAEGENAGHGLEIQLLAPTQIREPSAAAPEAVMTPQAPEPAERQPLDASVTTAGLSPNPKIKDEPMNTPKEGTPVKDALLRRQSTQGDKDVDENTLKAIEAAKNDFGLRGTKQKATPSIEEPPPSSSAATAGDESRSKKRPAPKVKKGQATVKKPPSKKRKVDDASSDARLSPSRGNKSTAQRAAGGAGKKSKSNTPALGSSPAPGSVVSGGDNESAYASDDDSDVNDVFCICRKGDNHTWMIACDGGCEDWFHGKCVNILEDDGELIDKYICPNCAKTSGKVTTWLPGCRNRTCRRPARIRKGNMSKYCSDKCGKEFMEGEVRRSEEVRKAAGGKQKPAKPKRKGITMAEVKGEAESDDDLGPRGGALKASELKVLVTSAQGDVSAFRSLGAGVLSPPATASPTAERFPSDPTTPDHLTPHEQSRLEAISKEKDHLRRRRALLKDREKFGQMVRENVARYAEREKVKPKDVCGYDNRLTWSEEEFKRWRDSEEGVSSLASGVLELPDPRDTSKPEVNGNADHMDVDSDSSPTQDTEKEKKASMCVKKRCERHRQWQKQALADVRFEESTLADQMRALEREEREIRELGALRGRMEKGGLSGEGTVEVVEVV
jgi:COMPASS component SPP1